MDPSGILRIPGFHVRISTAYKRAAVRPLGGSALSRALLISESHSSSPSSPQAHAALRDLALREEDNEDDYFSDSSSDEEEEDEPGRQDVARGNDRRGVDSVGRATLRPRAPSHRSSSSSSSSKLAIPPPRDLAHYRAMVYARAIVNARSWQAQQQQGGHP